MKTILIALTACTTLWYAEDAAAMNKAELSEAVAERTGISEADAANAVDAMLVSIRSSHVCTPNELIDTSHVDVSVLGRDGGIHPKGRGI